MRLLGIAALIIGILLGTNYVAFIPSAEAGTVGPFDWVDVGMPPPCNIWGYFTIAPESAQEGDIVAAFVADVETGTPTGCIGAYTLTQDVIDLGMYGTMSANADDASSGEKDGGSNGDTVTFKYYSSKYNDTVDVEGTATFASTETVQADLAIDLTPIIPPEADKGTVSLVPGMNGPPTWTYQLAHEEGSLDKWTYIGATITDADVTDTALAAGWFVQSQTATEVVFFTEIPMTGGEVSGFEISGGAVGMGDWICHDSSGNVEGPLPVTLSGFTAYYNAPKSAVTLKWSTASELNNLGFDIYRSESPDGKFVKISPAYIKGAGTDSTPHDYQFADESAVVGKTYYYYLETISFSGECEKSHIIKVIIDASGKAKVTGLMQPTEFALLQNFPNPFNPETWIPFHLAETADVTIRIFDIKGQELRTIHLGQVPAGFYDTKGKAAFWDGRDSYGQEVSSGIYFYHLTAGEFHATRKLTIIK